MPPLIRRRPLLERIKARLDPYDFLLWLSEELNDDAYDEVLNAWATPIGLVLNLTFILARAGSRPSASDGEDYVFGESGSGRGWMSWLFTFVVHTLTLLCLFNTLYTFLRERHYRLFEQAIDEAPTPSARRVRVDDSPATGSPIQYLKETIRRAVPTQDEPDATREVWEVSIWDAKPFNLTLFTLFSPGHLLVYYALLPTAILDPRPSMTLLLAIVFGVVLSIQLAYMKASFVQQTKDKALIQGEVLNEYNTKFVHPQLNKLMRDVSTQTRESALSAKGTRTREVDVYTPTVIINRGFSTNPNPAYSQLYSPQQTATDKTPARKMANASTSTSLMRQAQLQATPQIYSSPLKSNSEVDIHSPLRKASSSQLLRQEGQDSRARRSLAPEPRNRRETGRF